MKQNVILIVIALIVAGGIGYKLMAKSSPEVEFPVTKTESSKTRVKSSLKQLLGMGKNASCELSADEAQGVVSGKINISGAKMMADFKMSDEAGKMMDSHMINDGEFTYIWSSAAPQGTKIKNETVAPAKPDQTKDSFDEDKEVDMDCTDWVPTSESFKVPKDVEFLDMSNMMKGVIEQSEQPVKDGGSVCDAITDPQAKAICLQQMGN